MDPHGAIHLTIPLFSGLQLEGSTCVLLFKLISSKSCQPVCCNTRRAQVQILLIKTFALYELRNLISRNEMACLWCLHGKIIRYSELHIFRWVLLSKDKACPTLLSLLLSHHTIFLELGVVHQPARERSLYLAKEYSQTVFVRLESRKITQQFQIIGMVDHISECLICACAVSQVFVKERMCSFCFPLWSHAVINWVQTANC